MNPFGQRTQMNLAIKEDVKAAFAAIMQNRSLEGHWVVGVMDELQLVDRDGVFGPMLCDTKTRRSVKTHVGRPKAEWNVSCDPRRPNKPFMSAFSSYGGLRE
jgi:hypothetical protein